MEHVIKVLCNECNFVVKKFPIQQLTNNTEVRIEELYCCMEMLSINLMQFGVLDLRGVTFCITHFKGLVIIFSLLL